jgi:hypothetical protein
LWKLAYQHCRSACLSRSRPAWFGSTASVNYDESESVSSDVFIVVVRNRPALATPVRAATTWGFWNKIKCSECSVYCILFLRWIWYNSLRASGLLI